jgi:hypothetical protein
MLGKIITFCGAIALALACGGNALFKAKDESKSSVRTPAATDSVSDEITGDARGSEKILNQVDGAQAGNVDDLDGSAVGDSQPEVAADVARTKRELDASQGDVFNAAEGGGTGQSADVDTGAGGSGPQNDAGVSLSEQILAPDGINYAPGTCFDDDPGPDGQCYPNGQPLDDASHCCVNDGGNYWICIDSSGQECGRHPVATTPVIER